MGTRAERRLNVAEPSARSRARIVWSAVAVASGAVLSTSRWLAPAASGVGTHTQLGLPPCGFLALSGVPCPACGLTTSFAHMAHLQLARAFAAHPLGPMLFALTCALLTRALIGVLRGDQSAFFRSPWFVRGVLGTCALLLGAWALRLLTLT